jgi:pimeloyl-ACP methyl ester carboxylesterase
MHPDEAGGPTLVFHDPFEELDLSIGGATTRLAADRTAALASAFSWAYVRSLGKLGLRRPEAFQPDAGLRLFRQYQPGRIPVVFLHGLRSTPAAAWVQALNHLQNDPELAQHYQFWVFSYPTGAPLAPNAARLRADLRDALAEFDPGGNDPALHRMVLVGHSMGGLLAKMVTQDSGMAVWDSMFSVPPDQLRLSEVSRQQLVESLFYEREPAVGRLIFVATPHRGTELANRPLGRMLESKVVRQDKFSAAVREGRRENGLQVLAEEDNVHRLDGVGGLRPGAPVLAPSAELPIGAPYHSIIPLIGSPDSIFATDLAVPYSSSHLDGAESETILKGIHTSTDTPEVSAEIRRILLEHLTTGSCCPPKKSE